MPASVRSRTIGSVTPIAAQVIPTIAPAESRSGSIVRSYTEVLPAIVIRTFCRVPFPLSSTCRLMAVSKAASCCRKLLS